MRGTSTAQSSRDDIAELTDMVATAAAVGN